MVSIVLQSLCFCRRLDRNVNVLCLGPSLDACLDFAIGRHERDTLCDIQSLQWMTSVIVIHLVLEQVFLNDKSVLNKRQLLC